MRKLLFFFYFIAIALNALSQSDSLLFSGLFEGKAAKDGGAALYNGREHIGYLPSIEGTAYFGTNDWKNGTLVLQSITFKNALLKYDLVTDEVIVLHPNGFTGVTLFTPRIQSFTFDNHHFVRLAADEPSGFKEGIYEELSKGVVSLFAKHTKISQETIVSNVMERKFIYHSSYFLLKKGVYYPLKNEKAITDILNDKKKELDEWIKSSGLNYKSNPENALVKILEYYHQLTH